MIIGFRAGWGLGNALFISTALATIVGAASGGADSAIILYEAALGLGIAIGPLLGGALGSISWRGPFFGTAALMAIGLVAVVGPAGQDRHEPAPVALSATFRALKQPALLTLGLAALFYNFGFFSLLAYTPFPLEAAAHAAGIDRVRRAPARSDLLRLGLPWPSPRSSWPRCSPARFGRRRTLYAMLACSRPRAGRHRRQHGRPADPDHRIVVGGLFLGVMNTVLTESVMEATDLPRSGRLLDLQRRPLRRRCRSRRPWPG